MRLSISNIAWDVGEDDDVARLLIEQGIKQVDLAPGKYFADPDNVADPEIEAVRRAWEARGLRICGLQALLFGTRGLNMFADADDTMFRRLRSICRIGGILGAHTLTFGSPRQRDRMQLQDEAVEQIAVKFFCRLGDVAAASGVIVCLEPNPPIYGSNFMTCTDEAARMVLLVDHPAIRLQLDVGAMALNGEPVRATIERHAALICHAHASEPHLVTLGDGGAPHEEAGAALRALRPDLTVAIEMAASSKHPHLDEVRRASKVALLAYGDGT